MQKIFFQIKKPQNNSTSEDQKSTSTANTKSKEQRSQVDNSNVSNHQVRDIKVPNINLPLPHSKDAHSTPSISMNIKVGSIDTPKNRTLSLPTFKPLYRQSSNPAMAITLLKEIELIIVNWNKEIKQIINQIENIYAEGPIVDAWLESNASQTKKDQQNQTNIIDDSPHNDFRLCGLDENGQLWCRPCPPEQVHSISIAIARYQKLQQLLLRKQSLENRLHQLAETLRILHNHLQE